MHLQHDPLDLPALMASVSAPDRGALATFVGLVRDHHAGRGVLGLEYSAYGAMAEAECARIVAEAEGQWKVRVALAHRLGGLTVGEAAVIVVAASAHRDAAFEACRWVIESVKAQVPIWKRERYLDGSEAWVDPTAPDGTVPTGGTP
ncbi:MAG: molybdenum cofactor biosynthesis protein MoaE [Gemmatimonadales bacterium]|nr:molybdenum cofactor biosynthesis protein MoaE [Gemmatimonadales bacterium]MBP6570196.1 molybdenum cofactor biosynthesis protein MoaE [Gemmatimonadales bacterium]MBP7621509.1 molybdenum cofactor biosynthesis protein MoaE [Gemmatimonadales bacterium]MBP9899283.1 molybdenum cofactor biosynthesis protein MoaE [Gemmatimonadales bacterium]